MNGFVIRNKKTGEYKGFYKKWTKDINEAQVFYSRPDKAVPSEEGESIYEILEVYKKVEPMP